RSRARGGHRRRQPRMPRLSRLPLHRGGPRGPVALGLPDAILSADRPAARWRPPPAVPALRKGDGEGYARGRRARALQRARGVAGRWQARSRADLVLLARARREACRCSAIDAGKHGWDVETAWLRSLRSEGTEAPARADVPTRFPVVIADDRGPASLRHVAPV